MLSFALASMLATQTVLTETPAERDARMKWWREARFGMFIHWGLYAIPAGKWGSSNGHGEWIRDTAQIPLEEYDKLKNQFNPVKFDAEEWARIAKDAGMTYMVLTTKHHDGFCLWPTKQNDDWNVMATPFKRDILKELSTAVRKNGLTMGWYHSIMDWHHPDYLPRRTWEKDRPTQGADFDRFNRYLRNQVTELLTNYGPIGVMWFDGEWESTWSDRYGKPLYELCRTLQPNTIINNRVSNGRGGMEDASLRVGDFSTPEQHIPATGLPGLDWETCMTMNDHWGYNAYNDNWKSSRTLIQNLVDIASKGGNYLLNVGPKADGTFPTEAIERLRDMGRWMKTNGEAIYGTTASVFDSLSWGRSTTKGSKLYLHVFDWPNDGKLVVPGLANQVGSARILGAGKLKAIQREGEVIVEVPAKPTSDDCTVIALELHEKPVVYRAPKISLVSNLLVDRTPVSIDGVEGLEVRYTLDGSDPTAQSLTFREAFDVDTTTTIRAASFHQGKRVSSVVSATVTKVAPRQAVTGIFEEGLLAEFYEGDWEKLPDFSSLAPTTRKVEGIQVPMEGGKPKERIGVRYMGFVRLPEDGVYTFELASDDGARLWIGDQVVVDNDGLHPREAKTGTIALAKGWHPMTLGWFNRTGGAALELRYAKVGRPLQLVAPEMIGHAK